MGLLFQEVLDTFDTLLTKGNYLFFFVWSISCKYIQDDSLVPTKIHKTKVGYIIKVSQPLHLPFLCAKLLFLWGGKTPIGCFWFLFVSPLGTRDGTKTIEFSRKFQTAFDPPPSLSENHIATFSKMPSLKPCIKVQNLQYTFLDWKWPPPPLPPKFRNPTKQIKYTCTLLGGDNCFVLSHFFQKSLIQDKKCFYISLNKCLLLAVRKVWEGKRKNYLNNIWCTIFT